MPYKTERVPFSEIMPTAGKDPETVTDNGTEYDACHSDEFCKYNRANDISAYLKNIADIIAKLITVAVYHLFEIENDYRKKSIDRSEPIIL